MHYIICYILYNREGRFFILKFNSYVKASSKNRFISVGLTQDIRRHFFWQTFQLILWTVLCLTVKFQFIFLCSLTFSIYLWEIFTAQKYELENKYKQTVLIFTVYLYLFSSLNFCAVKTFRLFVGNFHCSKIWTGK